MACDIDRPKRLVTLRRDDFDFVVSSIQRTLSCVSARRTDFASKRLR